MSNSKAPLDSIAELTRVVRQFRDERDWKQFHTEKDMLIALSLEVSELAEHFLWKNSEEINSWLELHRPEFGEELADILYWVLLIAHDSGVNLASAFHKKMKQNAEKYPVAEAKGKSHKYTHYLKSQE
jgi:NTP pyrophosphatase (non-canonical NTP hydrolase)